MRALELCGGKMVNISMHFILKSLFNFNSLYNTCHHWENQAGAFSGFTGVEDRLNRWTENDFNVF